MTNKVNAATFLRPALSLFFLVMLQQKALAYSPEAAMDSLIGVVALGFFGIFIIVSILLYMTTARKNRDKEVNMGSLFLKSIGISILIFVLLAIFVISLFE